jgi:hypothetical protein
MITLPVESTGELPGGIVLTGADALREHLVAAHQHQVARSLVTRLFAYALGRQVERADEVAIEELSGQLAQKKLGIRDLINELVFSDPFNTK